MGNKQFKHIKPPTFNKDIWNEVIIRKRPPPKQEHGIYRIFANNYTGEEIQQYNIHFLNLPQFQKYIEFFQWRERQDNIVQTKFFNYEQAKQFCSSNYTAKVYIEHIPVRLSDIQDIPYPQNLYVLLSCLDGFEKLYLNIGYFRILEDLICMDRDGKVKVWMNPNLSQCHSYQSNFSDEISGYRQSDKLQEKMVEEIINIIEQNTTQTQEYPTISRFIRQNYKNKGLNFRTAKKEVFRYTQTYMIQVPNYFQSVIGVFDQQLSDNSEKQEKNRLKSENPYFNNQNQQNTSSISQKYVNHLQRSAERLSFNQKSQPTFRREEKNYALAQSSSKFLEKIPSYQQFKKGNEEKQPNSYLIGSQNSEQQKEFFKQRRSSATPMFNSFPHSEVKVYPAIAYKPYTTNMNNSNIKVKFNYNSQSIFNRQTENSSISLPADSVIKKHISSNLVNNSSNKWIQNAYVDQLERPLEKANSYQNSIIHRNSNKHIHQLSSKGNSSFNRLTYCDSQNSYELDSEIVEDMLKYLNF